MNHVEIKDYFKLLYSGQIVDIKNPTSKCQLKSRTNTVTGYTGQKMLLVYDSFVMIPA